MDFTNLNSIKVGADGRVSFSGLGSGIDFEQVVGDIIAAKRIPIDRIESRIQTNTDKITALAEMRSLLKGLRDSLASLRGAVSVGNAGNVFAAKQIFATSSRSDGKTPSAAGNLMGVSVTNAASVGSHTIEVLRAATAHKISSQSFASDTTALSLSGAIEVSGSGGTATVTVQSTDTLAGIRDRINNANTGVNATKVTASIVKASSNNHVLVLTADETGKSMRVTDSGTVLSGLGISTTNGTGGFRNGLASSKIDAPSDGFKHILFDGTEADSAFKISYDQATKALTMTRGDGQSQSVTLATAAIAAGATETATFSTFGASIILDSNFNKSTNIVVAADTASVTGGTGAIDASTIAITDSAGNISGITSNTLTFGNLGTPAAISVSVNGFTGSFDGTSTGLKTVTLTNGSNSLTVQFNVTATFSGAESAASIDLFELENTVGATGTQHTNLLQSPLTSRFTADGLLDPDRHESKFHASKTSALTTTASGSFLIKVGAGQVTVNFDNTDTMETLVTKINNAITTAGPGNAVYDAGTEASIFNDGAGFRMVITNTSTAAITLTDTNGLLSSMGVDNDLVIERTSNTINDLFGGVTLTLFQGEEGTKVKLDVEQNLTSAKSAIESFVTTYNNLKIFLNTHAQVDSSTGQVTEDTGVLFGTPTLVAVNSRLTGIFAKVTQGISDAYAVLRQIGITFVDKGETSDPLEVSTLKIDNTVLDEALLNNAEDIRRLFAFDFTSSDPRVSLLGFTGKTGYSATGYTLNINFADKYASQAFTDGGTFSNVDAKNGGPAAVGISLIAFGNPVVSGNAYRYSYNNATEELTLTDLTSGTSQTVDITATLDGIGNGGDLDAGETAAISFGTLNATITLSGDLGFARATPIAGGTLNISALHADTTMTGGSVALPASGMNKATVDALRAAGAYNTTSGLLTLGVTSSGAGEVHFDLAAGIKFRVDGGAIQSDITAIDLDDAAAHTVDIYVNDGASDVRVSTLSFDTLASTAAGSGSLTIDMGTGLLGETSTVVAQDSPMENYIALSNGTFEIRDGVSTLLGTVSYNKTDSLLDLAANITANVPNVSASIITSGSTFKIEIIHANREVLTFPADTGGLIAGLNLANSGDSVFAANIDGAASGADNATATPVNRTITATNVSSADGLKVFYDGNADLSGVTINITTGIGARLYYAVDAMLTPVSGLVDSNIGTLETQNTQSQDQADAMEVRLETKRLSLLQSFINMETALARAKNLQQQLQTTFDTMFANRTR